jgi:hypothetical protein
MRDPFSGIDALYKFTRITASGSFEIIEYIEDDNWPLMATTFRSLCVRLQIDPIEFGLSQ